MRTRATALLCVLLFGLVSTAHAAIITFDVSLNGASETPSVPSPGTGTGTVIIDTAGLKMSVSLVFSNLLGNTTASHIHCCNAPTTTSPVATQVPTFAGFPLGVTSGSYSSTFDMSLATSYNPTFITNNGGTPLSAFNALVAGMLDGRAYWNVHSSAYPGGEIRGALRVPEPGSLLLLAVALAAVPAVRLSRRR